MSVGGFARKHSSQRIICSGAKPCGSVGSTGPSNGRMFSLFLGNSSSNYFDYTTSSKIRGELMIPQTTLNTHLVAMFVITIALAAGGSGTLHPLDTAGPRSNIPAYPINVSDAGARLEEASVAWNQMSQHYGLAEKTQANLNLYTGTLESLPPNAGPIVLPK